MTPTAGGDFDLARVDGQLRFEREGFAMIFFA